MAITRFSQTVTSNLTRFTNWLNENKEGTFLDDVTITYDSGTNNVITFSTQRSTLKITFTTSSGPSIEVIRFTTNNTYWTVDTVSNASATAQLSGAILCSNGLIFDFYGKTASSESHHAYSLAMTLDSNGELAALLTSGEVITASTFGSWGVLAGGSSSFMSRTSTPYYGSNRICLAPLSAQANDAALCIPKAYVAVATPVSGTGLQSVLIDGEAYITNGLWYIKDAA